VALDFEGRSYVVTSAEKIVIDLGQVTTTIYLALPAGEQGIVCLVMGLQFFQRVNDNLSRLTDHGFNTLTLVHAEHV
jgi:hypothetical protein